MSKFGIDISEYQKGLSISQAKNEGVEFAIIRAGFTGWGTGTSLHKDSCFETFYNSCKAYDIPCGTYWYSCANTYEKGVNEANFMYENCLKGKQFEYPIYIDIEDTHHQRPAGKIAVTKAIKGFCETLESKGFYVGVYANVNWFTYYINTDELKQYDKWIASWGKKQPTFPAGGIWQFGGSTNLLRNNKIAGFVCDQDYSYRDYPNIIKNAGLNGFSKKVETVDKPVQKSVEELAKEVIEGKWGNGQDRVNRLTAAGYNYDEIQNKVNQIISANNEKVYIVKKGDTLSSIAAKYNTSYQKIAKDNNIANPNMIYPGQRLVIK